MKKEWTVWIEDSDEANDYLLTYAEAIECAQYWKSRGYSTILENINTGETKNI